MRPDLIDIFSQYSWQIPDQTVPAELLEAEPESAPVQPDLLHVSFTLARDGVLGKLPALVLEIVAAQTLPHFRI